MLVSETSFCMKPVVASENLHYGVALYQFCWEIMFLIFLHCFRRLFVVVVEISVIYLSFCGVDIVQCLFNLVVKCISSVDLIISKTKK